MTSVLFLLPSLALITSTFTNYYLNDPLLLYLTTHMSYEKKRPHHIPTLHYDCSTGYFLLLLAGPPISLIIHRLKKRRRSTGLIFFFRSYTGYEMTRSFWGPILERGDCGNGGQG
ncbi:hypothetical protein F4818DRAFT_422705 [Hypoxylon cercidicola]|nr:hypothetical protein F4818DRAFT_422705 [Hypoxylon cercidicola]